MDKWILKFVLFLSKKLVGQGVDFERLKIIVETKLLMDRRRVYMNWRQKQQKENSNPLLITLIIYAVFGIFVGDLVFKLQSMMLAMVFIHSYLLFMMAMTMITDFSSVLLDTADNQIILPRPVNSKTLFIARLVHILVYLLQFSIALAIVPVIFIYLKFGFIIGTASIVTALLTTALSVFITYLLYALILKFSNEQKIKDIVGYFQIFMTVFFAIGFQVVPRLVDFNNISGYFHLHWYSFLLPPVWMAYSLESLHLINFDWLHLLMIACAFLVPPLAFWVMLKYLAPSFANKLAALNNDAEKKQESKANHGIVKISEKISTIVCKTQNEISGFEMVWKTTSRDKGFKMQFYPSLAYIVVFIFIFVFKNGKDIGNSWHQLPSTKMYIFLVYMPMFTLASAIGLISFYENYLASWVYQSTPVEKPGEIIAGGLKALLTKFFLPIFFLLFSFALYVWGLTVADDFLLGFFNNIFIFLLIANFSDHYLPFSRQPNSKEQSGRFLYVILHLLIIAVLVGVHYLIVANNWLVLALIPFSCIGCYFLLKRIQNLQWQKISF